MEENNKNPKKKRTIEKVLMGAVIGGAIGSVVGASVSKDKGETTRKSLTREAKEVWEVPQRTKKGTKRFFSNLKKFFSKKHPKTNTLDEKNFKELTSEKDGFKKIPHEK